MKASSSELHLSPSFLSSMWFLSRFLSFSHSIPFLYLCFTLSFSFSQHGLGCLLILHVLGHLHAQQLHQEGRDEPAQAQVSGLPMPQLHLPPTAAHHPLQPPSPSSLSPPSFASLPTPVSPLPVLQHLVWGRPVSSPAWAAGAAGTAGAAAAAGASAGAAAAATAASSLHASAAPLAASYLLPLLLQRCPFPLHLADHVRPQLHTAILRGGVQPTLITAHSDLITATRVSPAAPVRP